MIYLVAITFGDSKYAVVAELADAHGSGPCGLTPVEVRVLSTASISKTKKRLNFLCGSSDAFFVCPNIEKKPNAKKAHPLPVFDTFVKEEIAKALPDKSMKYALSHGGMHMARSHSVPG